MDAAGPPDPLTWRRALGRRVAAAYAESDNVVGTAIAGSVGRGTADHYSDLEIDVYYHRPPTRAERTRAVERSGGRLIGLEEDEVEWEEQMSFGGFPVTTSSFLAATVESCLAEAGAGGPAWHAQIRLASLLRSTAVTGTDLITRWRGRAAVYPEPLQLAMLTEYVGRLSDYGPQEHMLLARADPVALYRRMSAAAQAVIGVLLALNRMYAPTPHHDKGVAELITGMQHIPEDLTDRLRRAFFAEPSAGVAILAQIIEEVLDLLSRCAPAFDLRKYQDRAGELSRSAWQQPPGQAEAARSIRASMS